MKKEIEYIVDSNGCHVCTSHCKNEWGHVQIRRDGRRQLLHRYLYEKENGKIPDGLVVRHKCDNASCINLDHLELGTHADNVRDRVERNRSAIGSNNGRSKLTEEDVVFVKKNLHMKNSELSKMFGVDPKVIYEIRKNKKWTHVQV